MNQANDPATDKFNADARAATEALRDVYLATQRQRQSVVLLEAIAEWARYWDLDISNAQVSLSRWVAGLDNVAVVEFYTHAHTLDDFNRVARATLDKWYTRAPVAAYPDLRAECAGSDRLGEMHSFWVRWLGIRDDNDKPARFADGNLVPL